jgi:hypothetical protein
MMIRTRTLIPALIIVIAVILTAVGVANVMSGPDSVSGQVVSVDSASVTTIANLTVVDASGKQWSFLGAGTFSGFTPSHLIEHRTLREPITVEYEESDSGELIIVGISD